MTDFVAYEITAVETELLANIFKEEHMSWSVSAIGKSGPVAQKLAKDFANITYLSADEAALKDKCAELVTKAITANTRKDALLQISASGSGSTHPVDGNSQTISLSITQLYGLVE
jgi:D-arabinose 5-phosphate isomerase GutQ